MSRDSCESHGWWEVDGQDECPVCLIARLRAELKIAKSGYNYMENQRLRAKVQRLHDINANLLKQKEGIDKDLFGTVCFERDEALARIKTLEATLNDIPCSGSVGCEALAQVAILIQSVQKARQALLVVVRAIYRTDSLENEVADALAVVRTTIRGLETALSQTPAKARALLDRLQRAEAAVEALSRLVWRHDHLAQQRGDLSEQEWQTARTALSAGEEGKG